MYNLAHELRMCELVAASRLLATASTAELAEMRVRAARWPGGSGKVRLQKTTDLFPMAANFRHGMEDENAESSYRSGAGRE
jgi:hypothetical protein